MNISSSVVQNNTPNINFSGKEASGKEVSGTIDTGDQTLKQFDAKDKKYTFLQKQDDFYSPVVSLSERRFAQADGTIFKAYPAEQQRALSREAPSREVSSQEKQLTDSSEISSRYRSAMTISERNDFRLQVSTNDGDVVTITAKQGFRANSQTFSQIGAQGLGEWQVHSRQTASLFSGLQYEVTGDLDAAELEALDLMFADVNELADQFFSGDLATAFDSAINFQLDSDQLSSIHLSLSSMQSVRMRETYRQVSPVDVNDFSSNSTLANSTLANSTLNEGLQSNLLSYLQAVATHAENLDKILALPDLGEQLRQLLPKAIAFHPARTIVGSESYR